MGHFIRLCWGYIVSRIRHVIPRSERKVEKLSRSRNSKISVWTQFNISAGTWPLLSQIISLMRSICCNFFLNPKYLTTKHSLKQSCFSATHAWHGKLHFVVLRLWISLSGTMLIKTTLARHCWTLQAVAAAVLILYQTLKTRSLSILSLGYFRHSLCQS